MMRHLFWKELMQLLSRLVLKPGLILLLPLHIMEGECFSYPSSLGIFLASVASLRKKSTSFRPNFLEFFDPPRLTCV